MMLVVATGNLQGSILSRDNVHANYDVTRQNPISNLR
jgi:hypothetical protein